MDFKPIVALTLAVMLAGCSTLNDYGIGGEPRIYCRKGEAVIDDRIVGPDHSRLSMVRRLNDADSLCKSLLQPLPAPAGERPA